MSESIITKKALSESLKELMKTKSFEKISVADIAQHCGLNRQTFYYHFQDKYALVSWIYYNEAFSVISENISFENGRVGFLEILTIMKKDQNFYQNTLKYTGQNAFREYLFGITRELLLEIIRKIANGRPLSAEVEAFIAEFYTYGIVGIVVGWARDGMKETPETLTQYLLHLINDSKKFAVERYLGQIE